MNIRQFAAALECGVSNGLHISRNCHAGNSVAVIECSISYALCTFRNDQICQELIVDIQILAGVTAERRTVLHPCRKIRHTNIRQFAAVGKNTNPQLRHTGGEGHAGKAAAASKSIFSDACHTVRNRHAGQTVAMHKCSSPNILHTGGNRHALNAT